MPVPLTLRDEARAVAALDVEGAREVLRELAESVRLTAVERRAIAIVLAELPEPSRRLLRGDP